ncbi:hypothetical protein K8I28_16895, partial [bacterium]|nr:hypothetical protein [bacterium]
MHCTRLNWQISILCLLVLSGFLCPVYAQGKSPADTIRFKENSVRIVNGVPQHKSPTAALLRSMVIPGWGQAYTEHYIKSVVYLGIDLGFIYGIHIQ